MEISNLGQEEQGSEGPNAWNGHEQPGSGVLPGLAGNLRRYFPNISLQRVQNGEIPFDDPSVHRLQLHGLQPGSAPVAEEVTDRGDETILGEDGVDPILELGRHPHYGCP